MKKILIDVDETITNNIEKWRVWYYNETGIVLELDGTEDFSYLELDPLDYFKRKDFYKYSVLNDGVLEFIDLVKDNYEIIFCSCCFPEHVESKKDFLARSFPDLEYHFVDTCSKFLLDVDFVIDDRAEYLRGFKDNVVKFQMITTVNHCHEYEGMKYSNWRDIIEYFKNEIFVDEIINEASDRAYEHVSELMDRDNPDFMDLLNELTEEYYYEILEELEEEMR